MPNLKPYGISIPFTILYEGPRCWKRYRTRSGKLRWRNYKRDVNGGVTQGEMLADTIKEVSKAVAQRMNEEMTRALWPA